MTKPLVIIGSGGHAAVLVDILRQKKRNVIAIISPGVIATNGVLSGIQHFCQDDDVLNFDKNEIMLINGIGSMPKCQLRANLYQYFIKLGYEFETVVAESAIISDYARLENGVQVMPGAIIQTGATIGVNSIINTGAIVDHDCALGANNHVAPGAVLSGQVISKSNVHFGTGSCVIQSIKIGKNVVVGAGASITKDIEQNTVCFPAYITKKVAKYYEK